MPHPSGSKNRAECPIPKGSMLGRVPMLEHFEIAEAGYPQAVFTYFGRDENNEPLAHPVEIDFPNFTLKEAALMSTLFMTGMVSPTVGKKLVELTSAQPEFVNRVQIPFAEKLERYLKPNLQYSGHDRGIYQALWEVSPLGDALFSMLPTDFYEIFAVGASTSWSRLYNAIERQGLNSVDAAKAYLTFVNFQNRVRAKVVAYGVSTYAENLDYAEVVKKFVPRIAGEFARFAASLGIKVVKKGRRFRNRCLKELKSATYELNNVAIGRDQAREVFNEGYTTVDDTDGLILTSPRTLDGRNVEALVARQEFVFESEGVYVKLPLLSHMTCPFILRRRADLSASCPIQH